MAPSSTRGRSTARDEADPVSIATEAEASTSKIAAEQNGNEEPARDGEAAVEGDEDEAAGGSGESSSATMSRSRSRKGPARGSQRNFGRSSRSRQPKPNQSGEGDEETDANSQQQEGAGEASESQVKVEEGEDGERLDGEGSEEDKTRRQRSVSGLKELAGLGLQTLGDGQEEPLMPRRSRRAASSPNESVKRAGKEEGEGTAEPEAAPDAAAAAEAEPEQTKEEPTAPPATEVETIAKAEEVEEAPEAEDDGPAEEAPAAAGDEEDGDEGVTRCVCGSTDENIGLMIQCEECKCWQHCICMGMMTEAQCPDVYHCEQCRPDLHLSLLKLLGVLPSSKNGAKKGAAKVQPTRPGARDSTKELKEAKEAVLALAKDNEKRREQGLEPITGWTMIQRQEEEQQHRGEHGEGLGMGHASSRRSQGELQRMQRSTSRDEIPVPKSPPKRRSTMNSRDSVYGWEPIPPGLLNEDEVWDQEAEEAGRKRKRGNREEDSNASHAAVSQSQHEGYPKRRRTSPGGDRQDEEGQDLDGDEDEVSASQPSRRGAPSGSQKRNAKDPDRPKHPNQYTKRAAAAAAAAAAASGDATSPGPSPQKNGVRRSARDTAGGSRMGTPAPGDGHYGRRGDASWGMPEHLSHLAFLLPPGVGPEPLNVTTLSAKSGPKTSSGSGSNATRDAKTDRIIKASPQAYNVINLTEATTKIKYPGKRMTMGEMRKRVRNILEFVSRLQIESVERERRMRFLGISRNPSTGEINNILPSKDEADDGAEAVSSEEPAKAVAAAAHEEEAKRAEGVLESSEKSKAEEAVESVLPTEAPANIESEDVTMQDSATEVPQPALKEGEEVASAADGTAAADVPTEVEGENGAKQPHPSGLTAFANLDAAISMSLVDELTRELLSFQTKFGSGTSMGVSSSGY